MMNRNINNHFLKYALVLCLSVLPWLGLVFLLFPQNAHAMEPIYKVLKDTSTGEGKVTLQVWNSLINIANTFVVVVLIAVAFAQILRINVSTYGVKKILPALVFAIIAANFSFLFCRLLIDFSNAVLSIFFEGVGSAKSATMNSTGGVASFKTAFDVSIGSAYSPNAGEIFWFILGQMFKIGAAVIVLILAFLFLIRNWMLYFLVALGPFCLMAMVLPQTKSIFTQWWSNLAKWIFMPIPSVFWLWVGAQWFNAGFSAGIWLINYVFAGICLYLAISSPFKLGGSIMGQFGGIGKRVWGATGGKITSYSKDALGKYYDAQKTSVGNRLKSTGPGQRFVNWRARKTLEREVPGMIKEKLDKDAKINAANRMLLDRRTPGQARGRLRAMLRQDAGSEARENPSIRNASVASLVAGLQTDPARGGAVVLPGPNDPNRILGEWTADNGGRGQMARLIRLSELTRSADPTERAAAIAALATIQANPNWPVDPVTGIARDPRTLDSSGYFASSAIGDVVGETTERAGSAIRTAMPAQASKIFASVAGHGNVESILKENEPELSKLTPNARATVEKSLKEMCDARDQAVTDIVAGGEEEIEKKMRGMKLISGGIASGKFGTSSIEMSKTLDTALKAIKAKDMDAINQLPEYIRGAGMGMDSKNPANTELYLKKIQGRAEAMMAANTHFQSLNGVALAEARAKLIQNPDQYIADVGQDMRSQNKLNASASVTGQMVANNMAANPAMQGVTLGAMGSSEHALKEVAESIQGLSEQMHGLSSGPLADPHNLSPSAVADKAEFMSMAKEVMKGAQQGAFAGGATVQSSLGDANTRRIFSEQLAKATATALGKTLKKAPLKVEMTVPKSVTPPATQPPASPEQTPPAPPAEPPKSPEK